MLFPLFFFFNDTATTEIYTLSLHDALPIYQSAPAGTAVATPPAVLVRDQHGNPVQGVSVTFGVAAGGGSVNPTRDRKSTRLNSSHLVISYAVFCLKKKKHKSLESARHAR